MQTQVHGGDIYSASYTLDFSTSISPLGVPEKVKQAYLDAAGDLTRYPDPSCRALRSALSESFSLPAEWFVCSGGAAELIYALTWAISPKHALLVIPSFAEYEKALKLAGCGDIRFYTCREETGFLIGEDLLDCITEDLDIFFLCNPNNPTGTLVPPEILVAAVEKCRRLGVLLVMDECYVGMLRHPKQVTMIRRLEGNDSLFIIDAFTKKYAIPGLRLGFGMTSDRSLAEKVREHLQPWNVSVPAQACGEAALREEAYVKELRETVIAEMAYLQGSFDRMGITWYGSGADFMFFKGPDDLAERCGAQGILIRDCSSFRGLGPGYFRVSCRSRRENELLCGILSGIYAEEHRWRER